MAQALPAIGEEVPELQPIGGEVTSAPAMNFAVVNGQRVPVEDSPIDLVKGIGATLNPLPALQSIGKGLIMPGAARNMGASEQEAETYGPYPLVKGLLNAQGAVGQKMIDSYQKGDYSTAARHAIDWLLPVIGPALDKAADEMQAGKPYRGAGEAIGLGLGMFGPEAIARAPGLRTGPLARNPNPAQTAAAEFGLQRGVPVRAGAATGNDYVKGVEALADNSPLGSLTATRAKQAEAGALERVGGELADDARGGAVTPEQAGGNIATALERKVHAHAGWADRMYDRLRTLVQQPRFRQSVRTGTDAEGNPIMEAMALPVDLRAVKRALQPIYTQLLRQYPLTQRQSSAGFQALENIINGPDWGPLTQVETDLGAIKTIARGADMPELRTQSQGLGASGVRALQAAVDRVAQQAGTTVWRALQDGRAATVEKVTTAEVLERIRQEPVGAYRQIIAAKDSGIDLLRTIREQVPQALPQIARAYLDDLLNTATAEGAFGHAEKLYAEWRKLGDETKALLFPERGQVQALDNYFLLAKMLAEKANPSRSALVANIAGQTALVFTAPAIGVPVVLGSGALARILRSPAAVRTLTHGLTILRGPGRTSPTLAATGVADIVNAAREAGVRLSGAPTAAEGPEQ